jgi:phosphatidylserine decarboxylase
MKKFLFSIILIIIINLTINKKTKYFPAINELINFVNTNSTFKNLILKVLQEKNYLTTITTEKKNSNITLEDVFIFFENWIKYQPTIKDATKYSDLFKPFYSTPTGKILIFEKISRLWLFHFILERGKFMDSVKSKTIIEEWLKNPEIKIDDYVVPKEGFNTFNDFFTRHLKEGKRPIDYPFNDTVIISPADCGIGDLISDSFFNFFFFNFNFNFLFFFNFFLIF